MIDELKKEIEGVKQSFLKEIAQLQSPENFSALKERYLSRKKGVISMYLSRLKEFPAAEKPVAGQAINLLKDFVESALAENEKKGKAGRGGAEAWIDHSLPASNYARRPFPFDRRHSTADRGPLPELGL